MTPAILHNRTYEEIAIGDSASLTRTAGQDDIDLFARVSGDVNPAHMDPEYAAGDRFGHVIVHGMWTASLVSAVLGNALPGPGSVYLGQNLRFRAPVALGDTITARVTVREKRPARGVVALDCECINQHGQVVLSGEAEVIAPRERVRIATKAPPPVRVQRTARFDALIQRARTLPPVRAAFVHPCSVAAIRSALEGREQALVEPLLIGPRARIQAAADAAGVSLDGLCIDDVPHSHAAAERGVQLGAAGEVGVLVKGSLHTDELLSAVVARSGGLRTDRWVSHAFVMDVPAYDKLLVVTDAAINLAPTLEVKRDIARNAIDLMRLLGVEQPKVAVLAAVETINPKMPSTLDAAALTLMAARGQISGGMVDGPLAFDNAIDREAARIKGIDSPVAGLADILLAPDIEAGNIAAKQLQYFAGADSAGVVLGAKVPVVLTSRSDGVRGRIASMALARLIAGDRPDKGVA
ncbi:MAG: bifunctional enoyl-CoA hydratase/phosphate acetyltransferase [Pseudoxanthomonas suwonensis]|nr:bifunctional enoyl-CoA hydratase/phosphate acetyltransferase [Pseudoxanthomonas suwonensis]